MIARFIIFVSLFVIFLKPLWGADVALIFTSSGAVSGGRPVFGTVVSSVVVAPASQLAGQTKFYVSLLDGLLMHGSVSRVDFELDAALIRIFDVVQDEALQEAHRRRVVSLKSFLPQSGDNMAAQVLTPTSKENVSPFIVRLNGQVVGDDPVALQVKRQKSDMVIEVVYSTQTPAWKIDVNVASQPSLGFWKKNRQPGLTEVPQRTLKYAQQALFRPIAQGDIIRIPVEVVYIKETDYEWTVSVETKDIRMEKTVKIRFQ